MRVTSIKCAFFALVAGLFLCSAQFSQARTNWLPTLRGEQAIERLKQTGDFTSLRSLLNDARGKNNRLKVPNAPEIVGQAANLAASGAAENDFFGISVGISGDTAVFGASGEDVNGNTDQGSAYVFTRSGETWTQQAKLTASDGAANDSFGYSVAVSGETIIVGASLDDFGGIEDQGSAYIFTRAGAVWIQQAQIGAIDGAAGDLFGYSVAISGDTAIVGAVVDDVSNSGDQGSAYIFTGSGATWTQQAQLAASDGAVGDYFGYSVGISGDTAIVGALYDVVGGNFDQGSAYVFTRNGATWTQQTQLTASDGAALDNFGASVAVSGDTAIVGASGDTVGANANQGSAYIFTRSANVWTQQIQFTATNGGAEGDFFGASVAISGNTAIVGAYGDDVGSSADQGSAHIFGRSGDFWTPRHPVTGGAANDKFGTSVAVSGDRAVVGAPNNAAAAQSAGTFINTTLVPTAAAVSISGRVVTARGAGLTGALVTLTDARGNSRTIRTGRAGAFHFAEVAAGETYILSVASKRYTFPTQTVTANEAIADLNFTPNQ